MTTLKKCPFCGGDAALNSSFSYRIRKHFVFVKCNICGGQGKIYNDTEDPADKDWNDVACNDAVNAWNMRTESKGAANANQ